MNPLKKYAFQNRALIFFERCTSQIRSIGKQFALFNGSEDIGEQQFEVGTSAEAQLSQTVVNPLCL